MKFDSYSWFLLIILIISLYGLYYVYYNSRNNKYAIIFNYITAISTAILALSVIGTFVSIEQGKISNSIKDYNEISDSVFDEIIELFLDNKDLTYLYNNIFLQIKLDNKINRNIIKEHELSLIIFSKFSKVIQLIKEVPQESYMTVRVFSMMDIIMKSKIMQNYWILYKKQFNPIMLIPFMNERYGL